MFLVSDLGAATRDGIAYLRALRPERVTALSIGRQASFAAAAAEWAIVAPRLGALQQLQDAEDHLVRALRAFIRSRPRSADSFLTVVVPEDAADTTLLQQVMRNRKAFLLKTSLLFEPGVVITDVPFLPQEHAPRSPRPLEPERSVVLVPVSNARYATARALAYAKSLKAAELQAIFMVTEPSEVAEMTGAWMGRSSTCPLPWSRRRSATSERRCSKRFASTPRAGTRSSPWCSPRWSRAAGGRTCSTDRPPCISSACSCSNRTSSSRACRCTCELPEIPDST